MFVWKKQSDKLIVKIPGLYHLQCGFFTNFSPTVQVLVNGEPALVLCGESVDCNSSILQRVHHSAGNIAGLSVCAFVALPTRAIVSVAYDIDEKAQAFLNLRKL